LIPSSARFCAAVALLSLCAPCLASAQSDGPTLPTPTETGPAGAEAEATDGPQSAEAAPPVTEGGEAPQAEQAPAADIDPQTVAHSTQYDDAAPTPSPATEGPASKAAFYEKPWIWVALGIAAGTVVALLMMPDGDTLEPQPEVTPNAVPGLVLHAGGKQ